MSDVTVDVTVQVIPYGPLTEALSSTGEVTLSLPLAVSEIRAVVTQRWPELRDRVFQVAVDQRLLEESAVVRQAEELALLPPFGGG